MEEEVNCRELFNSLKEDANRVVSGDKIDTYLDQLTREINNRVELIHKNLDEVSEEYLNLLLESYYDDQNQAVTIPATSNDKDTKTKETGIQKRQREKKEKEIEELNKISNETERNLRIKIYHLLSSLDEVSSQNKLIDEAKIGFESSTIDKIISIDKDGFKIKAKRKLGFKRKNEIEFFWDQKLCNASYSKVDVEDTRIIKIFGTTCYTYYQTNCLFKEEDVMIELEANWTGSDNYMYLGFINSSVVTTSNCMCCTIANAYYIHPNGDLVADGNRRNIQQLSYNKGTPTIIIFRASFSTKEFFVQVGEKEEQGPFKFNQSSNYRFVSGSCNSVNGTIKILSASYI